MNKLKELINELKLVFTGRGSGIIDSAVPVLVFLVANRFLEFNVTLWISLAVSVLVVGYRILRKQDIRYALAGIGSVLAAGLISFVSGSQSGYFLPGFISGVIIILLCVGSVLIRHPLAAYSSALTRGWPLDWYWHPKVRPAYTEVTVFWAAAFALRHILEFWLFNQKALDALGLVRIFLGWPYTISILVISYLYGQKRLSNLGGPSVVEFEDGKNPPWSGQTRGF